MSCSTSSMAVAYVWIWHTACPCCQASSSIWSVTLHPCISVHASMLCLAVCPLAVCPLAVCPLAVCPLAVCPLAVCPLAVCPLRPCVFYQASCLVHWHRQRNLLPSDEARHTKIRGWENTCPKMVLSLPFRDAVSHLECMKQ
jgi:hypothetical protein